MNFDALQTSLRAGLLLAVAGMGRDIVFLDQNAPRDDVAYVGMRSPRLVRETGIERLQAGYDAVNFEVSQVARHHYAVYVDLVVYRDTAIASAMADAWQMQRNLMRDDVLNNFSPAAFVDTTEVVDVAALLAPRIEPRAEFTARFRLSTDDVLVLPTIEQIEMTKTFRYPGVT